MPRAISESATANGITPPPATRPIGDEISGALLVMAGMAPSSMAAAGIIRKAQRAMLAVADEGEDLLDRRIFGGQRLHRGEPLGENTGAVKQLLIERAHRGEPFASELATPH